MQFKRLVRIFKVFKHVEMNGFCIHTNETTILEKTPATS